MVYYTFRGGFAVDADLGNVYTPVWKTDLDLGTLSFVATPNGEHQALLFKRQKIGKPARTSLALRAEALGVDMGTPPGTGADRATVRKEISRQVCRAEQYTEDRDAANARQKAYDEVKVSMS